MSAAASRPAPVRTLGPLDPLSTPPYQARGNGLAARSWVPVLDAPEQVCTRLLAALAAAGLPGCAAPLRPAGRRGAAQRLWVDAVSHAHAEDLLRRVLSNSPDGAFLTRAHPRPLARGEEPG